MRSVCIAFFLAAILCSCNQPSQGLHTAAGAGDIGGIDNIRLGQQLSAAPAGFHEDTDTKYFPTYIAQSQSKVDGLLVLKSTTVLVQNGAVVYAEVRYAADSDTLNEQVGKTILAGLKAEYGDKLVLGATTASIKDAQGDPLDFSQSASVVGVQVRNTSAPRGYPPT